MAGFISQESIDAVKNAADIVSVVSEYVKLDKRGSEFWGCCPFHGEKTASFHVVPEKNAYYCFGCHVGGTSSIKFIQEIEKLTFPEAVDFLAKKFGVALRYEDSGNIEYKVDRTKDDLKNLYNRLAGTFNYMLTQSEQGKMALAYIKSRGITDDVIEKFKFGYAPDDKYWLKRFLLGKNFTEDLLSKSGLFSKNYRDLSFFSDRFMIPIFDERGDCVAMSGRVIPPADESQRKYINSPETIIYSKKTTLFALNLAKKTMGEKGFAIICEGPMDCIAYHQAGITNAVASCGTSFTDEHIKKLKRYAFDKKEGSSCVYLSFDSDSAGKTATLKAILACRRQSITVKVIRLRGGKDPSEILLKYGDETLTADVNNAILDSDYLFESLSQEYAIDTPEGKAKVAMAYFQYIDALQTDIQKESHLDLLCQRLNLSRQAVLRDYNNREEGRKRLENRQENRNQKDSSIRKDAELRALLAVIADTNQFELMRRELNEDVFESPQAKELFIILEECYRQKSLSFSTICERCKNQELVQIITEGVMSGEYSKNTEKIVKDSIRLIKQRDLIRQRDYIIDRLKNLNKPSTSQEQEELKSLLHEKMTIDNLINC
ncbi:DNA primase [Treponema pectinovorum]|uniref:DNA primase n=1 Tax=Treponema pectinovorum TaxID=164 RepID=UPI0011CA1C86|nr:DNA primase [Treponema pectinovorum]